MERKQEWPLFSRGRLVVSQGEKFNPRPSLPVCLLFPQFKSYNELASGMGQACAGVNNHNLVKASEGESCLKSLTPTRTPVLANKDKLFAL